VIKKYANNAERQRAYRHRVALDRRNVTVDVIRQEEERINKLPANIRCISTGSSDIWRALEWLRVHNYSHIESLTRFVYLRDELRESPAYKSYMRADRRSGG
jgi:hypothetical protein